jgi:hypothetical protein
MHHHHRSTAQRESTPRGLCTLGIALLTIAAPLIAAQPAEPTTKPATAPEARGTASRARSTLMLLDDHLRCIAMHRLTSVTETAVRYVDLQGEDRSLPRAEVLAIVPADWADSLDQPVSRTSRSTQASLRLTDGVTLMGSPELSPDAGESASDTLGWNHVVLSTFRFKLDQIASIDLAQRSAEPRSLTTQADALLDGPTPSSDIVLLRNAEQLRGFVNGFQPGVDNGRGTPAISIEIDKVATVIPLSRVRAVVISNPRTHSNDITIALGDGSVISSQSLSFADDMTFAISLSRAGQSPETVRLTPDSLRSALVNPARVAPLATIPPLPEPAPSDKAAPLPSPVTIIAEPEPMDARSIHVRGPARARWPIPTGATKFGATLVIPDDARPLGDFRCVVDVLDASDRVIPGVSQTLPLSGRVPAPSLLIELPPDARTLRVTIEPGASGAVQASVLLRRAIFVRKP